MGLVKFMLGVILACTLHWIFAEDTRPGKHTKSYGKSPCFMGKSTIFMAIEKIANC